MLLTELLRKESPYDLSGAQRGGAMRFLLWLLPIKIPNIFIWQVQLLD